MITAHLIHDLDALEACSLTCRSWYIAVAPHLHHTLTLSLETHPSARRGKEKLRSGHRKLKPLSKLHDLGLIPLVKKLRVEQPTPQGLTYSHPWFGPRAFGHYDLRYFSAFTNVQILVIQMLEIHRFIPGIERYFEQFSPSLQSIALYDPRCTPGQLSHFLSLFSNLDDIEIRRTAPPMPDTTAPDSELVPFSAPKLRGRLTLYSFHWAEAWAYLITLCGGLRFRHMDLHWSTNCVPVLLEACAKTLETLRFRVRDVGKRSRRRLFANPS